MEIRTATTKDFKSICEYNRRAYPEKSNIDIDKYIEFWFSKSKEEPSKTLLIFNDDNEIVGQVFSSSMSYYFLGDKFDTVWGFDLMVDEEYRRDIWGVDLLMAGHKLHKYSFATGSNDNALALNRKLGCSDLGRIRKYVGLISPLNMFLSLFKSPVGLSHYPLTVVSNKVLFKRLEYTDFPSLDKPYNDGLLEISRDKSFLEWRYHSGFHDYAFYKAVNSDDYFVVRTIIRKRIAAMVLVDFRCEVTNKTQFSVILDAAKIITRKVHIALLIVGSSLSICDKVLEKSNFRSIGRPRPIVGWIKVKKEQLKAIENRNFIFVTLADSDGETGW